MVNSFDEWSPLKEAIVGSPMNYSLPDMELSFKLFFHDTADLAFYYPSYESSNGRTNGHATATATRKKPGTVTLKKRYLEELAEDVDGLVKALEGEGVKVHRPVGLDQVSEFKTPYWSATGIPALNVRDQAIIFGDEIVETAPQIRARYFENDLLKPIFYDYFKAGSHWTSMPKPMMTDRSFDLSYVRASGRSMVATEDIYEQHDSKFDVGPEMMIDAAQCIRFGKDVLVNVATENHELGLKWLQRHLGDRFRFHRLYRVTDNHIDSIFLPLRPGTLLLRAPQFFDVLPEALKKWDIIYPPEPTDNIFPTYEDDDLILTTKYIDLNVFSIDHERVVVNSLFPELIKTLESRGFTPIPVQHRHRRLFGGGFHCFTLDTVREGGLEDYFQ
jgi:glycine amidinotransferase